MHPDAVLPSKTPRPTGGEDAGWDIVCIEKKRIAGFAKWPIRTGLSMAIPEGWVGILKPRSGQAINTSLMLDAGVIDPGYRGEIKVVLVNVSEFPMDVEKGTKVAQMVFHRIPAVEMQEVTELPVSDRGEKGFGSTGK